ncbi:unnamed protein product [Trichobilharzia szidati]|nr:unnamed protein product [Trichobilharzia szidati]
MDEIITKWRNLSDAKKYREAYDIVTTAIQQGMKHSDLFWRKACSCRDLANSFGKSDKNIYKRYVQEGLAACEAGLRLNSECPKCNSWYAVFLNYTSQLEGMNKRIENSFKMKDHWMKAHKLDPTDYGTLHALGRWCFEVADLSWVKRKLAATLFSTPPTSSYDEALKYLTESERIAPGALVNNSLYLGKTYQRLKNNALAKQNYLKVLSFTGDDLETEEVIQCWLI